MKVMHTVLFTIEELRAMHPDAYKATLDKHRYINTDGDWFQFTFDEVKRILESLGFYDIDIRFSGFSNQGDGASFTAKWEKSNMNRGAILQVNHEIPFKSNYNAMALLRSIHRVKKLGDEVSFDIYANGLRYCHENSVDFSDITALKSDGTEIAIPDAVCVELYSSCRNTMRAIYRELEKQYDNLTSDAVVFETLEVNEYYFDIEGNIRSGE